MNAEKRHHSEIRIAINDKSQGRVAQAFRAWWVTLLYIYHPICWWNIFKIGEHLAKLRAKCLIVSCAPFVLHFRPQRCWTRQINWITCVLRTETVTNRCYIDRQINMSYYQQISHCCRPVLTYWPIDWCHQWLTDCWSCTAFCSDSFS